MRAHRSLGIVSLAVAAIACGNADPGPNAQLAPGATSGAGGTQDPTGGARAIGSGGLPAASGGVPGVAGGDNQGATGGADTPAAGQASGGAASGGAASGGAASGGEGGVGSVWRGSVAPGTCGVARRIRLPDLPRSTPIRREAGGFVAGPWFEARNPDGSLPVVWLRIDESGEKQTLHRATSFPEIESNLAFSVGAPNQVTLLVSDSRGPGLVTFSSLLLEDQKIASVPPSLVTVLKVPDFYARFEFTGVSPALDGQRALFAAGGNQQKELSVAVVAADGSPVGAKHTLSTTGSWSCRALQPTENAGALSVVELTADGVENFRSLELTATGEVAGQIRGLLRRGRPSWWTASPLPGPHLALFQDGLALLAFQSEAAGDAWHLHRVSRDGTAGDEVWDTLPDAPAGFAIQGAAAIAITTDLNGTANAVKRVNGQDQKFPLALEGGTISMGGDGLLAAEAGALFLDTRFRATKPSDVGRQIVEVTCP